MVGNFILTFVLKTNACFSLACTNKRVTCIKLRFYKEINQTKSYMLHVLNLFQYGSKLKVVVECG